MRLPVAVQEAKGCTLCEPDLPLGAKPLLQGSSASRVLIIGQAPGRKTHETGIPWMDASGKRLRAWLGLTDEQFYDPRVMALMPMGFCYPGTGKSGDLPPRAACEPAWHARLLRAFRSVELTLYLGKYAFDRYLSDEFDSMADAIRGAEALLPERIALPHPSPRNNIWLKKNPWFESRVLPRLREAVGAAVRGG